MLQRMARFGNSFSVFPHPNEMSKYLQELLDNNFETLSLPFITVHKPSNTIVGSTRYLNIDKSNYRLEIGHTWISKS